MKPRRPSRRLRRSALFLSLLLAGTSALALPHGQEAAPTPSPAEAREAIEALFQAWGQARVDYDRETMEALLAPEGYVLLDGERISRQDFLDNVSQPGPRARVTRFDTDILTVQRTEEGWSAVLTEKLEIEVQTPGGETRTDTSYWVTRDACSQHGGRWRIDHSEAIGYEFWRGTTPPIPGW